MSFPTFHRLSPRLVGLGEVLGGPTPEEQGGEYESGTVLLRVGEAEERWRIRTARITPTKPGAFVAVWERGADGKTQPFAADDGTAGLLVFVAEPGATAESGTLARSGVFRFTAEMLMDLGITQHAGCAGKRGFRLYPSWCDGLNAQAARTQRAQAPAFTLLDG
ncbi:hypothetical protein FB468_0817 [Leucobacter komagatae]|uniref:MepB protein n=1 Tax=Leucobacter komagatae TaxID=55969 RepID=A0A542Y410_9MICO|nr:MepB family protein [Leucobacter komagatae]TQL42809.1 hypothetical protein FB468_0817 [Leucobacter komagatae]